MRLENRFLPNGNIKKHFLSMNFYLDIFSLEKVSQYREGNFEFAKAFFTPGTFMKEKRVLGFLRMSFLQL